MTVTLFVTLIRVIAPGVTTQEVVQLPNLPSRYACETLAQEVAKLEWAQLTIKTKCVIDA